jgi:hypothetical protein
MGHDPLRTEAASRGYLTAYRFSYSRGGCSTVVAVGMRAEGVAQIQIADDRIFNDFAIAGSQLDRRAALSIGSRLRRSGFWSIPPFPPRDIS